MPEIVSRPKGISGFTPKLQPKTNDIENEAVSELRKIGKIDRTVIDSPEAIPRDFLGVLAQIVEKKAKESAG